MPVRVHRKGRIFVAVFGESNAGGKMRGILGAIAGVIVLASTAAFAQGWAEYRNPEQGFMVNFPADPKQEATTYMTVSGGSVPARLFSAEETGNRYSMTVVEFSSRPMDDDGAAAMAHAASVLRGKGTIRFDMSSELDGVHGHQLSMVDGTGRRILVQLYYFNHRLYIAEGNVGPNAFEPALFQTSVAMLHPDGKIVNLNREARERAAAEGKTQK
jgi:hypothetical protein